MLVLTIETLTAPPVDHHARLDCRHGADQYPVGLLDKLRDGVALRFAKDQCNDGRGVDDDHFGRPWWSHSSGS